jgi:hypothetical protein
VSSPPASIPSRCKALQSQGFEFFIVATAPNLARFELCPFGVPLKPVTFLAPDAYGWQTDTFLRLFHSMNTHVFGGRGLAMPSWVLVDHALLSSGLLVVACRAEELAELGQALELTADQRSVLGQLMAQAADEGFTGPIPVAAYCAAPSADPERLTGWSLCSVVPGAGLAFVAKGLALKAYGARVLYGLTQYDNLALRIHAKFGPARIRAAVVEIHTAPRSLVYETNFRQWLSTGSATTPTMVPTWLVSATDTGRHAEMQEMIDAREHALTILPPGIMVRGPERLVPILVSDYVDPDIPLQ